MAKKKTGKSLSQSIRDYLKASPGATPTEIVEGLAKEGIKVSPGLASNVKYTSGPGAKRKKKKTAKKRATSSNKRKVKRKRPSVQTGDIATLQAAAKFVAQVGDAETAVAAVKQVQALQID